MTPVPSQSSLVLTVCLFVLELDRAIHPPSCCTCRLMGGGCRSRRLGVTSSTGARSAALIAGGGKVALAEET